MINIYLFLLVVLCVSYLFCLKYKKYEKPIYAVLMIGMWLILCLRYGQGSDYFSYHDLFEKFSDFKIALYNPYNEHGEIGFRLLCAIFPFKYQWFIVATSTLEMWMLHRFIKFYSKNPLLTLLLFYPTYYLTYYFSIIRQGIVIAIFIGALLKWIEEKKWIRYYIVATLLITIHSTAAVLLIIPFLKYIRLKDILIIDMLCAVVGLFLSTSFGIAILQRIPQLAYYASADVSMFSLLERVLLFGILLLLYFYRQKYLEDESATWWLKIYGVGVAIYLMFLAFPLISSRFMALFKVLEVIVLPVLLEGRSKYRQFIIAFLIVFTGFMTCKNLDSYLYQGSYHVDVKFYTYPYITIFDKDAIWEYRDYSQYQPFLNSLK